MLVSSLGAAVGKQIGSDGVAAAAIAASHSTSHASAATGRPTVAATSSAVSAERQILPIGQKLNLYRNGATKPEEFLNSWSVFRQD